jgi:hypothetical protein
MALNRYLYPQKSTNIVQQVALSTRVNLSGSGVPGAIVVGQGITVAQTANPGEYTVTLDNASTVSSVVNVMAQYICAWDPTKFTCFTVVAVSTTGCTIQAYRADTGVAGAVNVAGTLSIELICSLSSVPA